MSKPDVEATRARRVRLTAGEREAQLLDIAEQQFGEHGYEGTTIDSIARAAGVSRAIVYQHHGTLDDVFIACVRRARENFEAALLVEIATPTDDWRARIEAGGNVYFDLIIENPQRWNLLFTTSASLEGHLADELTSLRGDTIAALATILQGYVPEVRKEALIAAAYVISGIGEQIGRWWMSNQRVSRRRAMSYYVAAVEGAINGIIALPHASR